MTFSSDLFIIIAATNFQIVNVVRLILQVMNVVCCDRSCTDLGDNDLEVIIVRGLNYKLPSGMLSFVLLSTFLRNICR